MFKLCKTQYAVPILLIWIHVIGERRFLSKICKICEVFLCQAVSINECINALVITYYKYYICVIIYVNIIKPFIMKANNFYLCY